MALTTDFAGIEPSRKAAEHGQDYSRYRIVPARHPGRLAGTIFAGLVIAVVLYSTFTNPRWGWNVFAEWFFRRTGSGRSWPDIAAHGSGDHIRFGARHGAGLGAGIEIAASVGCLLGVCLAAALHSADRAAAHSQQSRLSLRDDPHRRTVHRHGSPRLSNDAAADPVCRRLPRADAQSIRVLFRNRPWGHPVGGSGAA